MQNNFITSKYFRHFNKTLTYRYFAGFKPTAFKNLLRLMINPTAFKSNKKKQVDESGITFLYRLSNVSPFILTA